MSSNLLTIRYCTRDVGDGRDYFGKYAYVGLLGFEKIGQGQRREQPVEYRND